MREKGKDEREAEVFSANLMRSASGFGFSDVEGDHTQ